MVIELLTRSHDRAGFDCGVEVLNTFLRRVARQQAERGLGVTFVAVPTPGDSHIIGYYTLAMAEVAGLVVPERKLGVKTIPVVLLGRLAVDKEYKGKGIGKRLLIHALIRAYRASRDIGAYAVVLDALTEEARQFYLHFGFGELLDDPKHMYIPMKAIEKLGLSLPDKL